MSLEERLVEATQHVARREGRRASFSVTCVTPAAMRRMNRRYLGATGDTDVIAFGLPQPDGSVVGDVYICDHVVQREARARGIPIVEERLRAAVHGALHVLGYDHPAGPARTGSAMWKRQERYVRELRERDA